MSISGFAAKQDGPDEVHFTRPEESPGQTPKVVFYVQILLLVAMALSCWSAVANLGMGLKALSATQDFKRQVDAAQEHPAFQEVLDNPQTVNRLLAARGIEVEGELSKERLEADIARGRELVEVVSFLALHAVLAFLVLSIYFPFKYLRLVNGCAAGSPDVHRAIVATARIQLVIEAARIYLLLAPQLYTDLIPVHPAMLFSPVALLDVALLVFMTRPGTRAFFSVFRLVPTQEDPPQSFGKGFGCMVGAAFLLGGAYLAGPSSSGAPSATPRPSGAPSSLPSAGPTPSAVGEEELTQALTQLRERSDGLLTLEDLSSGRRVQFAGGAGQPLLLTAPKLSAAETERADAAFPDRLSGEFFTLDLGEDPRAAAQAGLRVFREVYKLSEPRLSLRSN
ncbi:MAG TPA: hypothetical protein DEA08_34465 [Planctomycetes bacterium]|nr:hypothetical protein [Planctomycetota bacterium]